MERGMWSRADARALEGVVAVALLLVGLLGVLFPILGVAGPFPAVDTRAVGLDGAAHVPGAVAADGVALRGTDSAELVFADPGLRDRVLLALPGVVGSVLVVVILEQLMRMARTFRTGDVFAPRNSRRLTVIAFAVLLIALFGPLVRMLTTDALVAGTPAEPAVTLEYGLSGLWVLVSLLLFAAAGAFRHGTRLRADTEGLV